MASTSVKTAVTRSSESVTFDAGQTTEFTLTLFPGPGKLVWPRSPRRTPLRNPP
jgi:hypothetical protein